MFLCLPAEYLFMLLFVCITDHSHRTSGLILKSTCSQVLDLNNVVKKSENMNIFDNELL